MHSQATLLSRLLTYIIDFGSWWYRGGTIGTRSARGGWVLLLAFGAYYMIFLYSGLQYPRI